MSDEKKVLEQKWYVVCQPWGDGNWIRAGAPDASGEFVCDCESLLDEADRERVESVAEIAEHIVRLHNSHLESRKLANMTECKEKIPSKEAIEQAMQSPQGERIKNGTATTVDRITVILASEAIQQAWDIEGTPPQPPQARP